MPVLHGMNFRPYLACLPTFTAPLAPLTYCRKCGCLASQLRPTLPLPTPKGWQLRISCSLLTISLISTVPHNISPTQLLQLQMTARSPSALQPLPPQAPDAVSSTSRKRASLTTTINISVLQHLSVPHHASSQKIHQEDTASSLPTVAGLSL